MSSVILDFLQSNQGIKIEDEEIIVLLQATSPVRQEKDLKMALHLFSSSTDIDLLMAVTQVDNSPLKYGFVVNGNFKHIAEPNMCFENRQNLPKLFRPTGTFYIFKAGWYRKNKSLATKFTRAYEIPSNQSLDIDSFDDLHQFESILRKKG